MHDVLVHYLEVNFPEIAEQLAHARTREPGNEERAAAAERLRELIRRLRRGAVESGAAWHEPRASAAEMIAGVNGELSPDERAVLDHFFELFARSMERTQAAKPSEPALAEAQPEPVAVTPVAEPAAAEAPAAVRASRRRPDRVARRARRRCVHQQRALTAGAGAQRSLHRRGPCGRGINSRRGRLGRCWLPRLRGHCPVTAPGAADRGAGALTAYPMAAGPAGCCPPRGPGRGSGDGAPGPQPGEQSRRGRRPPGTAEPGTRDPRRT